MPPAPRPAADAGVGAGADDAGVHLGENPDLAVDVLVDGERVWSFNPRRDAVRSERGWSTEWPPPLVKYLDGVGRVTVQEHVGARVLLDGNARFGRSTKRLRIRDTAGRPLSIGKTGHLGRSFAERDPEAVDTLVKGTRAALDFLIDECGIDAFLAFGGLLGAVRDGKLIGHDVDLDLGYVSRYTTIVDVALESFELERRFIKAGWRTWRYSADDFKVLAKGVSSAAKWIDIFGGFVDNGVFYLMPAVGTPADRVRLTPLGEIRLEGHPLPAPADPESLMAATYGPTWRVPDPSFRYEVPKRTSSRMDGWMRSAVAHRTHWLQFWGSPLGREVPEEASAFARWLHSREPKRSRIVDIGCGNGRDTAFFAAQGHYARGYDYCSNVIHRARLVAKRVAPKPRMPARFRIVNIYDLRQALALGGQLAHESKPVVVYARFVLNTLTPNGRRNLFTLARMATRNGGSLYLEFRVDADPAAYYAFGDHHRYRLDPDAIAQEIAATGGRIDHREQGHGLAVLGDEDPLICRMVVSWNGDRAVRGTGEDAAPSLFARLRAAVRGPRNTAVSIASELAGTRELSDRVAALTDLVAEVLVPLPNRDDVAVDRAVARIRRPR